VEESEPIAQPEEDENAIAEKLKKDKIAARLKEYHEQVKKYYTQGRTVTSRKGCSKLMCGTQSSVLSSPKNSRYHFRRKKRSPTSIQR